ncbi:zinc ABC transporter substrate-binding protein [Haemophilus paracuniculus]|uniref:High-affinity zinc uptake system protein ZnuA n=1 Tax=Haemophilus paracuniculus TaxID=734 RepID=A0A1T0AUZ3_9PAST|nr:zinc ABC transporter substrate-binding protein ZnuA [Haemophilus paracuniculus]OOS00757.1 zinc ABC transporter substrate-binding protein [Haemophilus paracuniculus]
MLKKSLLAVVLFSSIARSEVLTTVKPLAFIASAITNGITESLPLLPVTASPHDYSLKPSDAMKMNAAELVVWIGEDMETFLQKSIERLPAEKVLRLDQVAEIQKIVEQYGERKEGEKHQGGGDEHDHDKDYHLWFSPLASEVIGEKIAERLVQLRPEDQGKIRENLTAFKANLAAKNRQINEQLAPVRAKGYYTFHDAYGYFEQAYGLNPLGSFTINPSVALGAKTLKMIKQNVDKQNAKCLFTEPQFTPKVVESLAKNSKVKVVALDPLGEKITVNPTAYLQFLKSIADTFKNCLVN